MLSDTFSEGKLKDLRGSFPSDQPTELDDHDFLDDNDLEDVDDDPVAEPAATIPQLDAKTSHLTAGTPETIPEGPRTPSKNPAFGSGFASTFSPVLELRPENTGVASPVLSTRSVDPGTHLGMGKVVVLRDISFVT